MIVLPPESSIVNVSPMHITAARETVIGKGIAGSQEFDQLLKGRTSPLAAKHVRKTQHQKDKLKTGA